MYAMLTGCLPYTVEPFNITALHAKMLDNKMNPIPEYLSTGKFTGMHDPCIRIINSSCMHALLSKIVYYYQLRIHSECKDLLQHLLRSNPSERIKMEDIISHPWMYKGHHLPFQPPPFPNKLKLADISDDIVEHMVHILKVGHH